MIVRVTWPQVLGYYGFPTVSSLYLAVLAGAYELHDVNLVSDSTFDILAKNTKMPDELDFTPDSGQWVHNLLTPKLESLISACVDGFHKTKAKDWQHTEMVRVMQGEFKKRMTGGNDEAVTADD